MPQRQKDAAAILNTDKPDYSLNARRMIGGITRESARISALQDCIIKKPQRLRWVMRYAGDR
jgi:hypothetical protein